jgi:hypothetical protein
VSQEKVQSILAILGALVPVLSALASLLNHVVRERQAAGEPVSKTLLSAGAVLNVGAVNLDKALQLAKAATVKPAEEKKS